MGKSYTEKVFKYIKKEYGVEPDYPWGKYPGNAVFRHGDNKKWFALVMTVSRDKLGLAGGLADGMAEASEADEVDVVNVKLDDPVFMDMLLHQKGYLPAYHMNKNNWISVLLDGTAALNDIYSVIDFSFAATASKKKKEKSRSPKDWIIPANPKFYDVEKAFSEATEIDWKQGNGIKVGDTVYMYVAAPVSAILYKCSVLETNIPYAYQDKNLTISALMKIRLEKRYDRKAFTFDVLKEEYGIYAIRGPRGVPESLSRDL